MDFAHLEFEGTGASTAAAELNRALEEACGQLGRVEAVKTAVAAVGEPHKGHEALMVVLTLPTAIFGALQIFERLRADREQLILRQRVERLLDLMRAHATKICRTPTDCLKITDQTTADELLDYLHPKNSPRKPR